MENILKTQHSRGKTDFHLHLKLILIVKDLFFGKKKNKLLIEKEIRF